MKKLFALLSAIIVITLFTNNLFAQTTGKIAGKVIDQKTNETLIGATVMIQGTTKGVATNVDGDYTIAGLAPGRYTLEVKYVGYQTKAISDVVVKANEVTPLRITLAEAVSQQLGEVVIKATYRQASTASLYAIQKNNASISDGISSETIKRSPDRNTADVLKRVSGATVQDNKFVVVRGLSDRYNIALLDGAVLPSTEINTRAFSFDIVPSALIENLTITKTATPDLPGDFAGGAVNIITKDIPDQNFITVGIGGGYNTASTFKDFKGGARTATDYFAFDNGDKYLSSKFPSFDVIQSGRLTAEQNAIVARRIPLDLHTYNSTALPTQNHQFTIGRVKDFESGNRFGAIVGLTYRNSQNLIKDLKIDYLDYQNYNDDISRFSTNVGALANFGYSFGKNKITFKNIFNRSFDDQYLERTGRNIGRGSDIQYYAFDLLQKQLFKTTLEGNHPIGEKGSKVNWSLSYSNVLNDQPDQRKVGYSKNFSDPDAIYQADVTTVGKDNTTLFSKLNENAYSAAVNYTLPLKMFSQTSTFKAGLNSFYRDRNFDLRFIGLKLRNGLENESWVRSLQVSQLYNKALLNANYYEVEEPFGNNDSYTANSFTNSAYAMLDNKIGEKLRVVWGVRAEKFNLELNPKSETMRDIKKDYIDVLPSANFTYSVTEKTNLRASYYRTLARPEFRELAETQIYDYELLLIRQGNPDLKRTQIDNFDLRYELYPSAGQIISVSAFYKNFNNAIEAYNNDVTSTRMITYFNPEKAYLYGAEFEVRKSLEFINPADFMKNTTIYANVAIIKSKVENPSDGSLKFQESGRPMVGQAPYVVNAGLQHSFLDNKLNFSALYNKVGRRLYLAAGVNVPSVWEAPRDVVDLQLSTKLLKNKGELKFNANDILNQRFSYYFDGNGSKKYDADDETLRSWRMGANYSFTFTYTF
ncbi:TonB-dependent receptor [Mucilaginibacter limnophilus]|uniref:TonB-dependent receptor n=1 Tax=Mucilaginibacter limnophilus TaxID=1932778 RepID=A0A437MRE0_9SPHI|nr:TonB-dependent receptor [Mucilaginibacter limnophilus]RVU00217.1 TonB-dependent receptor [Mucilaginibacter limnophilus]